jgi:hypothetical protein
LKAIYIFLSFARVKTNGILAMLFGLMILKLLNFLISKLLELIYIKERNSYDLKKAKE